jgi:hypothetical protein
MAFLLAEQKVSNMFHTRSIVRITGNSSSSKVQVYIAPRGHEHNANIIFSFVSGIPMDRI